jgi:phosphatidylglycerophosphatase A
VAPGRTPADRVALLLATGLGAGYGPIAPGTWGSIPGVIASVALTRLLGPWGAVAGLAAVTIVGLWAADRTAAFLGAKDPGLVVIDEVAGQMVTLLFLPQRLGVLAVGFFLFRLFDVWKPWPARRLEDLPGGAGIMADDLAAGLYGNLVLQALVAWRPGLLGLT